MTTPCRRHLGLWRRGRRPPRPNCRGRWRPQSRREPVSRAKNCDRNATCTPASVVSAPNTATRAVNRSKNGQANRAGARVIQRRCHSPDGQHRGGGRASRGRGRRSTGTLDRVMQIGVVFPRNEFGGDVGAVGAYAQGVVQLGYPHLLAFDHLVGADPAVHKGRAGPRSADSSPLITAEDSSSRSKRSFRGLDRRSCRDSRASGPARTASRPSWWPASAPLSVRRCSARAAPAPSRGSGRLFDTLKLWA